MTPWLAVALASLLFLRQCEQPLSQELTPFLTFDDQDIEDHLFVPCPHVVFDFRPEPTCHTTE